MGMNETHDPSDPTIDDLAVYALDAHDPAEDAAITAYLDGVPGAARWERTLREVAGEIGAAGAPVEDPPAGLGARVREVAVARRAPASRTTGASPVEVHRVEMSRLILLLSDLGPDDWRAPVDPPEMSGWTVHDLATHVMANESLMADHLGDPVPGVTETARDNESRTAEAQARHRDLPPAAAVVELEAAAEAVDTAVATIVATRGEVGLDDRIEWWAGPASVRFLLLVRSFEAWTHADDVRRALGLPQLAPPPASMLTMASSACGFVPGMLAARGAHHPGRVVRFRFPDLDPGGAWDVDLGIIGNARPAGDADVDAELTITALDFCRSISARRRPEDIEYGASGDTALAAEVVAALPALAFL
jgi:uncharacterized protein (TIGR03083 family)